MEAADADPEPLAERFAVAAARLEAAGARGDDLCSPFLRATDLPGAVISTLGAPLGSQTVCASDPIAARIDEIQIDLGEGPCWDALRTRRPSLFPDFQRQSAVSWPNTWDALRELDLGALYAFPMHVGSISVGSVDLYSMAARRLSGEEVEGLGMMASVVARHVLRHALDASEDPAGEVADGPYSRREVHQASGMIAAQMQLGVGDALVVLRAHAFSSGRTVREVAADVVARRVRFDA